MREAAGPQDRTKPTPGRAGPKEWAALAVLILAVLLLAIDGTVLSLALPSISRDLDPSQVQLLWISDAYSFALAGLLVTMGSLGDRIGRKRLLLIGAAGFGAASLIAAFAPSPEWLIASRALLGVAGATIMPSTLSIIRNLFADARQRTTAISLWGAAATAGAALGPLVGGALLAHFWWGSVFIINLPVMALLLLGGRLIPESRDASPGPFDPISSALTVAAVVPSVYAIKEAAAGEHLQAAAVAAAIGVASGLAFVRRQRRAATPMLDLSLFRRPAFAGAVSANMLAVFALSSLLFFISLYLQLVQGYQPLESGLRQLPVTVASVAVVAFIGALTARVGRGRLIGAGLTLSSAGLATLAWAVGEGAYAWLAGALAVVGLGVGLALTLTTDAIVSSVPPEKAGAASAVAETAYELGIALGVALLGTLHAALYRNALALPDTPPSPAREAAEDSLVAAVDAASRAPVDEGILSAGRTAFVDGLQTTFGVAAVVLIIAGAIAWRVIPSERTASAQAGEDSPAASGAK